MGVLFAAVHIPLNGVTGLGDGSDDPLQPHLEALLGQ
jgi:hypothetical protein